MPSDQLTSPAGFCKIGTIVLGIVVVGLGSYSHVKSFWKEYNAYQVCDVGIYKNCPDIAMEQYFVAMVIICFLISICVLIVTIFLDSKNKLFKMIDTGYHGLAAIMLFIAGIVYIVSAEQINKLYSDILAPIDTGNWLVTVELKRTEKVVAGVLTILEGILYGLTAFFRFRQ